MNLTQEQSAYIDAASNGEDILLQARAGTGKTSTNIELAKANRNKTFHFAVFNKKNEVEMLPKLPSNCNGSTWHGFGLSQFKVRLTIDNKKVPNLVKTKYDPSKEKDYKAKQNLIAKGNAVVDLVSLLKNHSIAPTLNDANNIIEHFESECDDPEFALACLYQSDKSMKIDFDDMIRFPLIKGWVKPKFDIFIGDECQDNTKIRTLFLKELNRLGVQIGTVGDDMQSIYGWAGADCDAMANIELAIKARLMPLTVNFRCGKNIILEAQKLVPDIKAHEDAIDGVVNHLAYVDVSGLVKDGDCIIARKNRDIVAMCFKMIRGGKNATIQGVDFGKQLQTLIKSFRATSIEQFRQGLDVWREAKLKKCKGKKNDFVEDQFETLKFFSDSSNTVEEIYTMIDKIFSDEESQMKLSTAHKVKGLEFDRTFVLGSESFGLRGKSGWQEQQETNCKYVALTRAKSYMGLVN